MVRYIVCNYMDSTSRVLHQAECNSWDEARDRARETPYSSITILDDLGWELWRGIYSPKHPIRGDTVRPREV